MMLLKRPHESTEPEPCLYRPARRRCRRISDTPALLSLTRSHLRLHLQPAKATSKPSLISAAPTVKQQHSVSTLITSLPSELLLQIFSYLPFIDSIRSSQTCRKVSTTQPTAPSDVTSMSLLLFYYTNVLAVPLPHSRPLPDLAP